MIGNYFTNRIVQMKPEWNVSEDYYEAEDNIIAVYDETGESQDPNNETNILFPSFMVFISSKDWAEVKRLSYVIYKAFHNVQHVQHTNADGVKFYIFSVVAIGTPNRLGVIDGQMQYTINFQTTIKEVI